MQFLLKPNPKALGPLDKRTRRTRCAACAQRRIKCQGGFPCQFCSQNKRTCIPPGPQPQTAAVFINHAFIPAIRNGGKQMTLTSSLSSPRMLVDVPLDLTTQLIGHFFTGFLAANDFTGRNQLDLDAITSLYQKYPSLYHATIAVAALDAGKRSSSGTAAEATSVKMAALSSYRTSLVALQSDLTDGSLLKNEACLWSTFFLGIFELMYDATGEGWVKHILYGTSKILQVRGPENCLFGPGRLFFLTVRIFEICRAAIYMEPTFLSEPKWQDLMTNIWLNSPYSWHPKEAVLDILTDVVALSHKASILDEMDRAVPDDVAPDLLMEIVNEGLRLQSLLEDWSSLVLPCDSLIPASVHIIDTQTTLAHLYHHGTQILLSGIFDYRPYYSYLPTKTPSLPQSEIQKHVSGILRHSALALSQSSLSGVLFFFPLRVAGARARSDEEKQKIISLLEEISRRNFVVAGAFIGDLKEIWKC